MLNQTNLIQPKETETLPVETQSTIVAERLNPMVLVQQGGVAVAVILAVSILILTLAEFAKVILGAARE